MDTKINFGMKNVKIRNNIINNNYSCFSNLQIIEKINNNSPKTISCLNPVNLQTSLNHSQFYQYLPTIKSKQSLKHKNNDELRIKIGGGVYKLDRTSIIVKNNNTNKNLFCNVFSNKDLLSSVYSENTNNHTSRESRENDKKARLEFIGL